MKTTTTTIRVHNSCYYAAWLGVLLGVISLVVGLVDATSVFLPAVLVGLWLLLGSLYFLRRHRRYKLELSPGVIKEYFGNRVSEYRFRDLKKLDIDLSIWRRPIHPIFYYYKNDGSEHSLRFKEQVAFYDVVDWVKKFYPQAEISEKVQKWCAYPKSKFFFGSTWNKTFKK